MRVYQNYHRHSYLTNPLVPDSTVTNKMYAKKAVEYGHGIISSCEHGWQGNPFECYDLAKEYGLTYAFVVEAYWVNDRFEKDRTNCHIILAAKNENGRQAINDILSEANITGFYGRARVDRELILSLPPDDVIVTTACVAFWKYDDVDRFVEKLANHFKNNFFLEVQYHNTPSQKQLNHRILELSDKLGVEIIMGCDSHYIDSDGGELRDNFLLSKNMEYEDEEGWYLDYVDGDTAYQRFIDQGVLTPEQIEKAMDNTNVFLWIDEYTSPVFNKDMKMINAYPELTQNERNQKYLDLIWSEWNRYKVNVPQERWPEYEKEIEYETSEVIKGNASDYFLANHAIIRQGVANGGVITPTGRGSAVSFFTNRLLNFTKVDRIAAPVTMYPERFLTSDRLAVSMPDIDFNCANVAPFALAQKQVLGDDHAYPMVAFGTQKASAAWKMYARSQQVPFDVANEVSEQLKRYEKAVHHADDDEKDLVDIADYITDPVHQKMYEESKKYQGIITDIKIAPCSYLLYQGSIRREVGLIKVKEHLCCAVDGHVAEVNRMLKNDLLKVSVVDLISRVFKQIGVDDIPSIDELRSICPPEDKTWDMYAKGITLGLNQVEQKGATHMVSTYKPQRIDELCAFVAAIRPGFKSMYLTFESRQPFDYGVESFDNLIQTPNMPYSFIMYQEQAMKTLNYAGISMTECYAAIKNIAKKRAEKVLAYKNIFLEGFSEKIQEQEWKTKDEADVLAEKCWQIIEDASGYSFNSCVSGDTKIQRGTPNGRFEPTVEEMYLIMNDKTYAQKTGHINLHKKYRRCGYGSALSMYDDGRIRKNKIVDIRLNGVKDIYRVMTESGAYLDCTMNHKFPTLNGKKKLEELHVGDLLYVKGKYETTQTQYRFTNGNYISNVPVDGEIGFQLRPDGESVKFHTTRNLKVSLSVPCESCGCEMTDTFELHHIDGDRTHNDDCNLIWLCNSCHKKAHYAMGRVKQYQKGIPTVLEKIVSIEYLRTDQTYDIEMEHPAHTYVSESGLVTSNSHAYCVAGDSLYGAYLKAHHPLEFYACLLEICEEKGEKDRMAAIKEEAQEFFGIKFPNFQYGQDNREIHAVPEDNAIVNSLTALKGFSKTIGDGLYECSLEPKEYFVDVLDYLKTHNVSLAKAQELASTNYYFNMYGDYAMLSRMFNVFELFNGGYAKTIKKSKLGYLTGIAMKYGRGTTANGKESESVTFTTPEYESLKKAATTANKILKAYVAENGEEAVGLKLNAEAATTDKDECLKKHVMQCLREIEEFYRANLTEKISKRVQIQNQFDVLGEIIPSNKREERRYLYVVSISKATRSESNTKVQWGWRVLAKSLGTGKTADLTLTMDLYRNEPISSGDIIYAEDLHPNKKGYWYLDKYHHVYD